MRTDGPGTGSGVAAWTSPVTSAPRCGAREDAARFAAEVIVLAMDERRDGGRDASSELDSPRHQATVLGRRFNGIDISGWPIIGMGGLAGGTGDCHAMSHRTSGIGVSLSFCTVAMRAPSPPACAPDVA
ncbi:hypothetical protein PanNE5_26560 [Pandoraea sp. NE5]|nr:hypothetical protein PanNE5_26560 [Pandoraea sp. NE5]